MKKDNVFNLLVAFNFVVGLFLIFVGIVRQQAEGFLGLFLVLVTWGAVLWQNHKTALKASAFADFKGRL